MKRLTEAEKIVIDSRPDLSTRKLAKLLWGDKSRKSTIIDYRAAKKRGGNSAPKILFYDIETAPIKAHLWSMWQQGVGLNQIESDWHMLSFCCKWAGSDEVFYFDQRDAKDVEDDKELVKKLWAFLDECDIAVGHNSKKFDTKKANARFILNGLPKPSPFRQIDTLDIAKRNFAFTSNKLQYLTENLCVTHQKSQHQKFAGHELWVECLKGNPEAWQELQDYNFLDVLSLEELYNLLAKWDDKLPVFEAYTDEIVDSSEWVKDGFVHTNLGKYQRYKNVNTGQYRRGHKNLLTKEKRDSLLRNIV